jgi:hypothetical protein
LRTLLGGHGALDVAICAVITIYAAWLTSGLWPDPARRVLSLNPNDQALDEWFLAHGTRLYSGDFHLVTTLLNAPDGVNLLGNASLILLGVVLAPVTLAFGAPFSFAVIMGVNLAATGIGWYLLFARTLRLRRAAAAVGAAFTAFAPGIVAQANAHVHMTAQWLVPPMIWCVLRLTQDRRFWPAVRMGTLLGVLIVLQVFLGEEVLFLTAITLGLFCVFYAVLSPGSARRALPGVAAGVGVAAVIAVAATAHLLWLQFAGPQSVPNGPFSPEFYAADLAGLFAISPLSLAGSAHSASLVTGSAEYTSFFGWPLVLVVIGATLWLWRRPAVVASALTAMAMCALALGPEITLNQHRTGHSGPYKWVADLPLLDYAQPTRLALAAIPPIAFILATAIDAALADGRLLRFVVPIAVVAALIPLAPGPLPVQARSAAPKFFSEGYWRSCVQRNGVLVPVPLPNATNPDTMRWAAAANDEFGVPQGSFIGPYAADGRASVGVFPRPTARLLDVAQKTNAAPVITAKDRDAAATDVDYWGASCFVVADNEARAAVFKSTLDQLFGPGEHVVDVWMWRV